LSTELPKKVTDQIGKAGLPTEGEHPFKPSLVTNRRGEIMIQKATVLHGPKKGKMGFVDEHGRIWIKDHAHADVPDHWDVQEDGGESYFRVDEQGNKIP
jgi:hypothetical protein